MRYCKHCGTQIQGDDQFCGKCGARQTDGHRSDYTPAAKSEGHFYEDVPDHLLPAILVTIFCCLPLGVPAIVYAAMANSAKASGNYQQAIDHANTAKTWVSFAFGLGIIAVVISLFVRL